jgi:Predicted metal binding domain
MQYVDIEVSRPKFDREIREFRDLEAQYRRRGWFLLHAEYPDAVVLMAVPHLTPPAILTAVAFEYSNYDAEPPSVKLVNPFTFEPYLAKDLPTRLDRNVAMPNVALPFGLPPGARLQQLQPLMQWYSPEDVPFLCIAGVREYHEHPAHGGDAWPLHRAAGAGRMVRILEVIHKYGIEAVKGVQVQLIPQVTGFQVEPPE